MGFWQNIWGQNGVYNFFDPLQLGEKFGLKKGKKGFPGIELGKYDPEMLDLLYSNITDLIQGRGKEDIMGEAFLGPSKRVSNEAMVEAGVAASGGATGAAFQSEGTAGLVDTIVGEEGKLKDADLFGEASLLRQERLQEGLSRGLDLYGKQVTLDQARKGQKIKGQINTMQGKMQRNKALTGAAKMFLNKQVENKAESDFMEQLAMMVAKSQAGGI